jgi:hypothetical protein
MGTGVGQISIPGLSLLPKGKSCVDLLLLNITQICSYVRITYPKLDVRREPGDHELNTQNGASCCFPLDFLDRSGLDGWLIVMSSTSRRRVVRWPIRLLLILLPTASPGSTECEKVISLVPGEP